MTSRIFLRAALACALALGLTLAALGQSAAVAAKAGPPVERLQTALFR